MRKIAVALSKGGVGKTTTAVNLAAGLANAGQRVLLVDMDAQGQVAKALSQRPEVGLAEVIMDDLPLEQAVTEVREGVWLLAGGQPLAGVKRAIARKDFGGERTLAEALTPLDGQYDLVILDTAPGWDTLMVNALFYADEILSPVSLEVMALQGMIEFSRSLDSIQQYHPDLTLRYVLPTFMDRRVKKSEIILKRLQGYYRDRVCQPIRYNVRLSEAPGYGRTIFEYSPRCPGAEDYQRLTEKVLHDSQPEG